MDPGSTDGSREFLKSLQPGYKELELIFERDSGPADGLNNGLLKSTGDFVLILNADDYLLPGAYKSMIDVMQKYPGFEGYSAHGVIQNEIVGRSTFQYTDEIDAESIANGSCVFIHPSMIVARNFLKEKSIFFNLENKTCWDLELICDFLEAGGKFRRSNSAWSVFRIHNESISGTGNLNKQYILDNARLLNSFQNKFVQMNRYSLLRKLYIKIRRKLISLLMKKRFIR